MKKVYTLILGTMLAGFVSAQSFTSMTPTGSVTNMVTASGLDVSGDTAAFTQTSVASTLVGRLWIINTSGSTKSVKVERTVLSEVAGSTNLFCWDLCYSPSTNISTGNLSIAAGDTVTVFYGDYSPDLNAGTTTIKYKFYDMNNTSDFVETTIIYTAGVVGLEDEHVVLSSVYPNPASQFINFDYNIGSKNGNITISDITGKIVRNSVIGQNSTKHTINLEGLTDGVYIYTFYAEGKPISTRKFIVRK